MPAIPSKTVSVLVTHLGSNGGGPKFTYELLAAMDKKASFRAHYLIARTADNRSQFEATQIPNLLIPTYRTRSGLVFGLPRLLVSAIRVRSYIRKNSISVVINAMHSIYQGLFVLIAIPRGVQYVSCVHDAEDHPGDEHVLKKISRWGELRRADEFVAFSEAVAVALKGKRFICGRPVRATVHGVFGADAPTARNAEGAPSPDTITVGFLGRLGKYKGLQVFNDAVGVLTNRGFKVNAVVYGAGPEAVLSGTSAGSNLEWHVGWIQDEDIPFILDTFDILILPYTEASQSGVIAYALARGLPVVVTPVGGLGEQVLQANCGVIAKSTSPEDVADALEKLISDPVLRKKLGANALHASKTVFSWERVADDFAKWLM